MKDRWGEYYSLTGFEAIKSCFWCGLQIKGDRRYCCEEHHDFYLEYFHWPEASSACLARQEGRCGDCATKARWASDLRVHHIEPLNGAYRQWNILNRPENLIALCPSCHGKRHAKLERLNRYDFAIKQGQIPLTLMMEVRTK